MAHVVRVASRRDGRERWAAETHLAGVGETKGRAVRRTVSKFHRLEIQRREGLMATKTIITCDVCGKQKGETNGWYLAAARSGGFIIYHATRDLPGGKDICG